MIYFIADTHFSDERIIKYENRPFVNTLHMNDTMICTWNSVVKDDDIVFHLGDVGDICPDDFKTLRGKKILIKGNHDTKDNDYYRRLGFHEVYSYPIIFDGFWILSHEPLYVNTNMPYANIFGHVHSSMYVQDYSKQHYCVSVERINYTPISFEEVKEKVRGSMK